MKKYGCIALLLFLSIVVGQVECATPNDVEGVRASVNILSRDFDKFQEETKFITQGQVKEVMKTEINALQHNISRVAWQTEQTEKAIDGRIRKLQVTALVAIAGLVIATVLMSEYERRKRAEHMRLLMVKQYQGSEVNA